MIFDINFAVLRYRHVHGSHGKLGKLKEVDPEKLFRCELCIYSTLKKSRMSDHVLAVHFKKCRSRDWTCGICDKSFYDKYFSLFLLLFFTFMYYYFNRSQLKLHKRIHFPKQYKCRLSSCKFEAAFASALNRHKLMYHQIGSFNCSFNACGQIFATKFDLVL